VGPRVVGTRVGGQVVRHLDELGAADQAEDPPAIGVIATPASAAETVADVLVAAGAASILNFAPRVLNLPARVLVRYVDLSIELQVMSFLLSRRDDEPSAGALGEGADLRTAGPGS
jgi:redox-sensing transcriptional repressor